MDLVAGVTVGVVALPLAMAFGIASGVTPAAGIYTAIVAGFLISVLGGTRVSIGGPTGAFIAILYGIYQQYGANNAAVCTIMAGGFLVLMGLCRAGTLIKFIPFPVTMGFTSGIAIVILFTQVKDFLGLEMKRVPVDFLHQLREIFSHLGTIHSATFLLAIGSLVAIRIWPDRWGRYVPGSIIVLTAGTILVGLTQTSGSFGLATIGSRFGGIPQGPPVFTPLHVDWFHLHELIRPAFTIALLAAIESLLCAVVADGMTDDRHDSNTELVAQGIANICTPLLGGIAATGAIARTATNVKNGARSPIAGIVHAFVLLVIVLVAAPLAKFIPLAVLSAVLVNVALNMGEWHHFARLRKWPRSDASVFLLTFVLTVAIDLTVAVEAGLIMAAALFIKRISELTNVNAITETQPGNHSHVQMSLPAGVMVYRMHGAFFFGAVDKLETALKRAGQEPEVLILQIAEVMAIDATGLNALEDLFEKLARKKRHLILVGPHTQPLLAIEKCGLMQRLGMDNLCAELPMALARAEAILAGNTAGQSGGKG